MPRYKKKITRLMEYDEFKASIDSLPIARQAFLSILFFAGCRVSEALALESNDIHCTGDTIFIQFFRLDGDLFSFSRSTAYRTVKKCFPKLYPHYFRMNRITKTDILFGDATVYHVFGISASSIDHYRGKVDIKRVGTALREELG